MKTLSEYCLIVSLLSGCANAVNPIQNDSSTIVGRWQLEVIKDNESFSSKPSPYMGANQIQVIFQDNGNVLGTTSRNSLTGSYEIDNKNVKITTNHSEIAETEWGTKFLNALPSVNKYEVSNDSLKLIYEDRKQLVLVKVP